LASETILVVDDTPENLDFIVEHILQPNDFQAMTASNGHEGFKLATKHEPDLILLDLQMPKMNGREMLMAMNERGLDIPVLLMTFHGSEEIAIEMFRMGVKDYLRKPYTAEEMLASINRCLSEVRMRKEKDALTERLLQANRELHRRVQELNTLYQVGKTVASTAGLPKLLPQIIESALEITEADEARLMLAHGDQLHCRAEKRQGNPRPQMVDYIVDDPAALHVLASGKGTVAKQAQYGDYKHKPLNAAYVPLVLRGQAIGVLMVANVSEQVRDLSRNDISMLSALSDYAAIAVENSRHVAAIKQSNEQEKQEIRSTFERFVAPSVVQRALANPDDLHLGGNRQQVTILFADIRGYTAWSEQSPPEQVMEMLNDYLSLAAELVLAWEGTLDKFFGDGLMAIFNAPENQPDHVHLAVDTGLALLKAAQDLNKRKGYGLSYSIGVNVGEAVVGYIGTERALNYTAVGDVVNLAKRMQENAKPGQILVEQTVVQQLGGALDARKLGDLPMRNRKQPAHVYEVLALKPLT
jgi:class 3 adenylate cyclase/DNA-binding response OmpR family regulator